MKYKFKCPKCGGADLTLVEEVLTLTGILETSKSEDGMEILEYGESEQVEVLNRVGYRCGSCYTEWCDLDEIDEDGGFIPVTDTENE